MSSHFVRHSKELEDIGGTGSLFAARFCRRSKQAYGLSPSFVVYDELGQSQSRGVVGRARDCNGKRVDPMLWIISTQAATDSMPMSKVIDYGLKVQRGEIVDPSFHLVLHAAPLAAPPWSRKT